MSNTADPARDLGWTERDEATIGLTPRPRYALHPELIPLIQFFTIEITPLVDGNLFVGIAATLCERDGELSNIEIATQRVERFDEALRLIAETTIPAMRVVQ
jgi:hypothetical protein